MPAEVLHEMTIRDLENLLEEIESAVSSIHRAFQRARAFGLIRYPVPS